MSTPTPSMRDLARRVLVTPGGGGRRRRQRRGGQANQAEAACQALRVTLIRLAGADGCDSLMRRALALAREEVPELQGVRLGPDGIEGLDEIAGGEGGDRAAVALVAHLLSLLGALVGEPLTMRLVRETWPDAKIDASPQSD